MSESFAIVLHCFFNGLANVTREKWATERIYCGNGLSPLPHTSRHLEIQSLYCSEFLFYSNSSKCLNFSSCVIGDLEIEIRQWAFLVKINAVATKPWLCRLQKLSTLWIELSTSNIPFCAICSTLFWRYVEVQINDSMNNWMCVNCWQIRV